MSKKECLDDMFLNRISIIVGQEDENQIKQEIEQIGYKEFYRYNTEKSYLIEEQKIEIKKLNKEIERLNKQLQLISDEFLKYDWENSSKEQIINQLKNLYNSIFKGSGSNE